MGAPTEGRPYKLGHYPTHRRLEDSGEDDSNFVLPILLPVTYTETVR